MKLFSSEQSVLEYFKASGHHVIIFEGSVYDVTDYLKAHPGGADQIEPYLGLSIDEPFKDIGHTKAARLVFREIEKVGVIAGTS